MKKGRRTRKRWGRRWEKGSLEATLSYGYWRAWEKSRRTKEKNAKGWSRLKINSEEQAPCVFWLQMMCLITGLSEMRSVCLEGSPPLQELFIVICERVTIWSWKDSSAAPSQRQTENWFQPTQPMQPLTQEAFDGLWGTVGAYSWKSGHSCPWKGFVGTAGSRKVVVFFLMLSVLWLQVPALKAKCESRVSCIWSWWMEAHSSFTPWNNYSFC